MEGLIIVTGFLLLFALIASRRFIMLGKMADEALTPCLEAGRQKYRLLEQLVDELSDPQTPASLSETRELKALKEALGEVSSPGLPAREQIELENRITALTSRLTGRMTNEAGSEAGIRQLSELLEAEEAKLLAMKEHYNQIATHYNNAVYLFPSNVFALFFGYRMRKLFTTKQEKGTEKP